MKKRIFYSALLFSLLLLTACGKNNDTTVYSSAVAALADDEAWEFVDIGAQYPVMLVSSKLIEDGRTNRMSASCDVYYMVGGQATDIGKIECAGTEYQIRADDSGIYAASDQDIRKYKINDSTCTLELEENGLTLKDKYDQAEEILFGYGAADRKS